MPGPPPDKKAILLLYRIQHRMVRRDSKPPSRQIEACRCESCPVIFCKTRKKSFCFRKSWRKENTGGQPSGCWEGRRRWWLRIPTRRQRFARRRGSMDSIVASVPEIQQRSLLPCPSRCMAWVGCARIRTRKIRLYWPVKRWPTDFCSIFRSRVSRDEGSLSITSEMGRTRTVFSMGRTIR